MKRLSSHVHFALLCVSPALLLAGCGTNATTSAPASHGTGGTAVVALAPQTPPNWFFPVVSADGYASTNFQINFLMYRPLVYISKTNQINYQKSLATSIKVNPEGTVYTITLGTKYKWSNGKPVTAQDVLFTWNLMKAASASSSPWLYGDSGSGGVPTRWSSVSAPNAHTVVVTLAKPSNPTWFIHNGLSQISPVPESLWNKYPHNMIKELRFIESEANNPSYSAYKVVDGAFHVSSWEANNYWDFVPNQKFGGHKAAIAKLVLKYEASASNEFAQLKTGTVNVGYLPPSMWSARKQLTGDKISASYVFGMNYIEPNMNANALGGAGPLLKQLYVRQALQMGIDQLGIVKSLYHGFGLPTDGSIAAKPATPFYDPALNNAPYHFDVKAGESLLERHGWRLHDGVMTRRGKTLSFTLLYSSGSTTETGIVQLLKQDWAEEGIDVSLQSLPLNQLFGTMGISSKWALAYWNSGYTYQLDYYPSGGSLFAPGAAMNGGNYNNAEMNKLITATYLPGTASQSQTRLDAYQKFGAIHLPGLWMPWIPQGYARVPGFNVHSDAIHGTVKYFNPVTNFIYANYWTISS